VYPIFPESAVALAFKHRFGLWIEEVLQAHAEHECDAQKRWESWMHQIALQLRQQRGRKARVIAEFAQSHALAQPQPPEFLTNRIPLQTLRDRLGLHLDLFSLRSNFPAHFETGENT
jgi:hypothetical protein